MDDMNMNQNPQPPMAPPPAAPQTPPSNGMAIAALICGILGIVGSFIPIVQYFTFVLAILGIVFGVKARKDAAEDKRGLATAGLVLGIIGTALGALGVICVVCVGVGLAGAAGAAGALY